MNNKTQHNNESDRAKEQTPDSKKEKLPVDDAAMISPAYRRYIERINATRK